MGPMLSVSVRVLVLVVSIRDNQSQAYQQIHRINPVLVDFQGVQAKKDRLRLLLYRIFQNRMNVSAADIANLIKPHIEEFVRLAEVSPSQYQARQDEFAEAWPYSPVLMQLLEDQVLVATEAQETRDLIRILVDLFKNRGDQSPVITPSFVMCTSTYLGCRPIIALTYTIVATAPSCRLSPRSLTSSSPTYETFATPTRSPTT